MPVAFNVRINKEEAMPDRKHRLDWRWDMSYAIVTGTPTGWEVRCDPRSEGARTALMLTAYFEGRKFGTYPLITDADDIDDYEKVINENPHAVEAVMDTGALKVREFVNAANQILGIHA